LLIANWPYQTGFFVSKDSNVVDGDIGGIVDAFSIARDEIKNVNAVERMREWG